jgi:hypothetical protein
VSNDRGLLFKLDRKRALPGNGGGCVIGMDLYRAGFGNMRLAQGLGFGKDRTILHHLGSVGADAGNLGG